MAAHPVWPRAAERGRRAGRRQSSYSPDLSGIDGAARTVCQRPGSSVSDSVSIVSRSAYKRPPKTKTGLSAAKSSCPRGGSGGPPPLGTRSGAAHGPHTGGPAAKAASQLPPGARRPRLAGRLAGSAVWQRGGCFCTFIFWFAGLRAQVSGQYMRGVSDRWQLVARQHSCRLLRRGGQLGLADGNWPPGNWRSESGGCWR
jgi:hypothetical protein